MEMEEVVWIKIRTGGRNRFAIFFFFFSGWGAGDGWVGM